VAQPCVEEHLDISELSLRVFLVVKRRGSNAVVGGVGGGGSCVAFQWPRTMPERRTICAVVVLTGLPGRGWGWVMEGFSD